MSTGIIAIAAALAIAISTIGPAIGHGLEMLSGRPADCVKLTD